MKIPAFSTENNKEYEQVLKLSFYAMDLKHYTLNVLFWNSLSDIIKRRGEALLSVVEVGPIITKVGPKLIEAINGSLRSPNDDIFKKVFAYARLYAKVIANYCDSYGSLFNSNDFANFSRLYYTVLASLPQYNPSKQSEICTEAAKAFASSEPKEFECSLPVLVHYLLSHQLQENLCTLLGELNSAVTTTQNDDLKERVFGIFFKQLEPLDHADPKDVVALLPALFIGNVSSARTTICRIISAHYNGPYQRIIDTILYNVLVSGNADQSVLAHEFLVSIFKAGDHKFRIYYASQVVSFLDKLLTEGGFKADSRRTARYIPTGKGTLSIVRLLMSFSFAGSEDIKQVLRSQMVKPSNDTSGFCNMKTGNWYPSPLAIVFFVHLPLDVLFSEPMLDTYFRCFALSMDGSPSLSVALCLYGISRHKTLHKRVLSEKNLEYVSRIASTLVCSEEYIFPFFASTLVGILENTVNYLPATRLPSLLVILLRYAASPSGYQELACSVASFCAKCSCVQRLFNADVAASIAIIFRELLSRNEHSTTLCYVLKQFVEFALNCENPTLISDAIPPNKEGDVEFFLQDVQLKETSAPTQHSNQVSAVPSTQLRDLEIAANTLEVSLRSVPPSSSLPPELCAKLESLCHQISVFTNRQ